MYLHTKFQVSNITLTSFRQGLIPLLPTAKPLKSPPSLGLNSLTIYVSSCTRLSVFVFHITYSNSKIQKKPKIDQYLRDKILPSLRWSWTPKKVMKMKMFNFFLTIHRDHPSLRF